MHNDLAAVFASPFAVFAPPFAVFACPFAAVRASLLSPLSGVLADA
jgi:hypothetical protein